MNHGWSLRAQYSHCLENIDHPLVLHALQHDAERDENARSADASAAMHGDGPVLTELLLRLVHLADEVDEPVPGLWNALLGPVDELELSHGAACPVPRVRHLELSQDVLGHVVLGDRVDDEALVTDRPVGRPVLMALLPPHLLQLRQHDDYGGVVLPEHAPKVVGRVAKGTLSGYVGASVSIPVDQARVYVIRSLDVPLRLQANSGALVRQDVDQAIFVLVAGQVGRDEAGRVHLDVGQFLELQLHARDALDLGLHQLLNVGVQVSGRYLGVAADHGLVERVVYEYVLVLGLDHVVPLGAQTSHVAVNVDHLLVFDPLEHRVDHYEATGPPDPRAAVHDQGAAVGRVQRPDPAQELQERRRMLGHAVVRPGGKLQLLDLPPLGVARPGYLERADAVGGELLDVGDGDGHQAVSFGSPARPILVALYPRPLLQFRHHHDRARPQLPTHPPEVAERFLEGALGGHVRVLLPIPVAVIGVYVIRARHPVDRLEDHPRVVVRDHVRVTILRRVHLHVRVVPGELLAGLDRLVLLAELQIVVRFQPLDVIAQLGDRDRRMGHHARRLEI